MRYNKLRGDSMSVSEAQKRATSKYESRNYDKILIRLKKENVRGINAGQRKKATA